MASNLETLVTVFGGSGFLGRNVVRALAKRDYRDPGGGAAAGTGRAPAAARPGRPDPRRAGQFALSGLGRGRDARFAASRSIWSASWPKAARNPSTRCRPRARRRSPRPPPPPARGWCMCPRSAPTKIRPRPMGAPRRPAKRPCWPPCRRPPSCGRRCVFGPEDQFTNRFAALARISPFLPLIGGGVTRMQPAYVGDVATAVADAVDGKTKAGRDLRTRRAGSADHARDHGNHSCDHRAQAHAGFAAVRPGAGCRRCSCNLRRAR